MATEQYANLAATTLDGSINNSTVSITVTSATGFPTSNQYRVVIDTEIIIVTAGAGTTSWTVTRGAEGTTAASHSNLAAVTQVLTRDGLKALGTVLHPDGTYVSRAAAAAVNEGVVNFPSDGVSIQRSNGSLWVPSGPLFPMVEPIDAQFAWVNQGLATVDTTHGGIALAAAAGAGTDQLRCRVKTVPTAPYTLVVAFIPMFAFPSNFNSCGILLRDSGSGKIVTFGVASDNAQVTSGQAISIIKWNSATSFSAFYTPTPTVAGPYAALCAFQSGPCVWFRIVDDNTNRILSASQDGVLFHQLNTIGRTDFITPNQLGFFVNQSNATYGVALNVLSWRES